MKKELDRIFAFALVACIAAVFFACSEDPPPSGGESPQQCDNPEDPECSEPGGEPEPPEPPPARANGPVECYGKLKASGNRLVGSKPSYANESVQVRGVSFGWSTTGWESSRFFTTAAVNAMVDDWKAEVIRAPLGIGESNSSYINVNYSSGQVSSVAGKDANKERVTTIIDAAIEKGVYAIIDWHSHGAHVPAEREEAVAFFREMAQKYGNKDHVIFEIYNEPLCENGGKPSCDRTTWAQIKEYAEAVIPVIREHSPDNLILVGTPFYCQTITAPRNDPINDPNVAYVFHFYAGSREHELSRFQNNLNSTLSSGLPIFVSEYGTVSSDGGQNNNFETHNEEATNAWHGFMDANKISSAAWQVNDKHEGSCFFGFKPRQIFDFNNGSWADESKMSESGKYIFRKLRGYSDEGLPWHNCKR